MSDDDIDIVTRTYWGNHIGRSMVLAYRMYAKGILGRYRQMQPEPSVIPDTMVRDGYLLLAAVTATGKIDDDLQLRINQFMLEYERST